jgi:uncharacterized protein YkwD
VKSFLRRQAGIALTMIVLALGATACLPSTATPISTAITAPRVLTQPPSDPLANAILLAVNADRAANGLPGLSWNPTLTSLATAWSRHMADVDSMYHQDLNAILGQPAYASFTMLGENLLVGPADMAAKDMEAAWMNSPLHRANVLSAGFNTIGVGYAWGRDGRVWVTIDFGRL